MGQFLSRFYDRLLTAIYAPQPKDGQDEYLRIGLIGGDIPVFPPLLMVLLCSTSFALWYITGNQLQYILFLSSSYGTQQQLLACRILIASSLFGWSGKIKKECYFALQLADAHPNFKPVSKDKGIADTGPYSYSRNMMYISAMTVVLAGSIAFDTGWLLVADFIFGGYLQMIVIPAEERFLDRQLGVKYKNYCQRVPRWL